MLADDRGAVLGHLGPGKAEVHGLFQFGEERVVASGGLGPAFDHMPGDDCTGESVPVGSPPAVMPHRRAHDERSICDSAGDDDVGPVIQCGGYAPPSEVRIRGDQSVDAIPEGLAGVEMLERLPGSDVLAHDRHQIVTGHRGDLRCESESICDLRDGCGTPDRVEASGVRDDPDPALEHVSEYVGHLVDERATESAIRSARPHPRQDDHRELGEPIAGEHVDGTAVDHLPRRRRAVSEEPRDVCDANRCSHPG